MIPLSDFPIRRKFEFLRSNYLIYIFWFLVLHLEPISSYIDCIVQRDFKIQTQGRASK